MLKTHNQAFNYSRDNIEYIEISEGSSSVRYTYFIYNEPNNITVKVVHFNCGETIEMTTSITEEDMDRILSILEKYKVDRWNNFNKKSGKDGDIGFGLEVVTVDKNDICAYGDGKFPENYEEYNSEIMDCLYSLFESDDEMLDQ